MRRPGELNDDLVRQVDQLAGTRGRSSFVRAAVERVLALRSSGDVLATTAINVEEIARVVAAARPATPAGSSPGWGCCRCTPGVEHWPVDR